MLEHTLYNFLKDYGLTHTFWVAYSGGLDSHVLLHLCTVLRQSHPFTLRVVHVHHGLSANADHWLKHCAHMCEQYQVEFVHYAIDAKPSAGESLENTARQKRYDVFKTILKQDDMLLTAQHQDDQAETVLLQLLRGAGPKGLSAMPKIKPFGLGWHARPLLAHTRAELKAYAELNQLSWIEDELNRNTAYPRNYIRHEIIPLLKKHWPKGTATIARAAENCAEAQQLLDHFLEQDLSLVAGVKQNTLSVKGLLKFTPTRQRSLLRAWFNQQGFMSPSAVKLQQIQQNVLHASEDGVPCVTWADVELRRYQDDLYVMPSLPAHNSTRIYSWDYTQPLLIPGLGELQAIPTCGQGLSTGLPVSVRFRQGGEKYQLSNSEHHHPLKKFFQEQGIPPWLRNRFPLLYVKDEMAAIPGYLIVDKFKTRPHKMGYQVVISFI